jgi:hypothetical protein
MPTDEFVKVTNLHETTNSLRRIDARLPAELRVESERVAGRLDQDAKHSEAKLTAFDAYHPENVRWPTHRHDPAILAVQSRRWIAQGCQAMSDEGARANAYRDYSAQIRDIAARCPFDSYALLIVQAERLENFLAPSAKQQLALVPKLH